MLMCHHYVVHLAVSSASLTLRRESFKENHMFGLDQRTCLYLQHTANP